MAECYVQLKLTPTILCDFRLFRLKFGRHSNVRETLAIRNLLLGLTDHETPCYE